MLSRFVAWLEADTARAQARLDYNWSRTAYGAAGIPRERVGRLRQFLAVWRAARAGRYQ